MTTRWTRWIGLVIIATALLAGDQIRLKRPDHKYRLTIAVETAQGVRTASGVFAVHPNRAYGGSGSAGTETKGDALVVDLGNSGSLVLLIAQRGYPLDIDGMNYIAMRAINAATGKRVQFRELKSIEASAAVADDMMPVMLAFADINDPSSARVIKPDQFSAVFGAQTKLQSVTVATLPPGWWPIDFGGSLGEPVTRSIDGRLQWWPRAAASAAQAVKSAGLVLPEGVAPISLFRR